MITPPTVTARNDRAKLAWKNLCRRYARMSSSAATTMIAALIAALAGRYRQTARGVTILFRPVKGSHRTSSMSLLTRASILRSVLSQEV
jgi:hypothetical protein